MTETRPAQNIRCIAVRSDGMDDWWTIERAEHDGRFEMVSFVDRTGFSWGALVVSSRLGDESPEPDEHNNADIEGTSEEMLAIADAIETGGKSSFKRCAAKTTPLGVELMSPRNSRYPVTITHECAKALAADIRAKVRPNTGGG